MHGQPVRHAAKFTPRHIQMSRGTLPAPRTPKSPASGTARQYGVRLGRRREPAVHRQRGAGHPAELRCRPVSRSVAGARAGGELGAHLVPPAPLQPARHHLGVLRHHPAHGFHGETPSAAGIARWSAARHRSPDEGDALLYACAQVNVMPMEPMGSTDDADAGRTGDPAGTGHEPRARSHAASAPPPVPPYQTPTDERSPLVMRRTVLRGVATTALIVATGLAAPVQALAGDASGSDVVVVDEPDTSGLDSTWTTALLGIPIFGAIQSVEQVPGRLIPGFPALPTLPSL